MAYTHLQVKSGYSLMSSTIQINKLVTAARSGGYDSIALTDEGVMHGAIEFYQTCKKEGIKPIIGMTMPISWEGHETRVVLLAENFTGYQQLLSLSTQLHMNTKATMDLEELENYTAGLLAIVPAAESPLAHWLEGGNREKDVNSFLEAWKSIFKPENFYLGVQDHNREIERKLHSTIKKLAEDTNTNATAVNDVRYIYKEDHQAFDCLTSMRDGERWTPARNDSAYQNRHLKTQDEMEALFGDWWPEVLEASRTIASRCSVEIPLHERKIPRYPVESKESSSAYLRGICEQALNDMERNDYSVAKQRLDYELNIITSMEFSDYFLIVWDFISFAKKQGIMVGPGRGSAAGSFVAYLLGITAVDPLSYDLLFERFLNPERISMPDIDIDFSDHRRDEVIRYVHEKYGPGHVAQIVTFGTFAARSLLRELFKTIGIDQQDASFILKEFSSAGSGSIIEVVKQSEELAMYVRQSSKLKLLFQIAAKLEGLPRHTSTHAAGVIISDEPLTEHVALLEGHEGVPLTQYAMGDLETIGLLKMDFLGLRNLTLLERIETNIKKYEDSSFTLGRIPLDDQKTFHTLREGRTNGIFQLESQGMRNVLQQLKPNHFEDVVAVNALYRPGPMEYIPLFIARKHGKKTVEYPHSDIQPILEKTFGVLVYQEQIMQVANRIAGFSLGEADILRRAVSKKKKDVLEQQRKAFVNGCKESGYDASVGEEIYQWIVKFSNYGFNRSHAVAYSMISYQLAYLKTHYPACFLSELMNSQAGNQDKLTAYIREARDFGINILPPSVNESFAVFRVTKQAIRMGLLPIKGVGYQAIQAIIDGRRNSNYKNLFDFCLKVSLKAVNRSVIESLILAGAFDETYDNRARLLASIDHAMEQGELFKEFEDQPSFFQNDLTLDINYIETEPFSRLKQLALEKEVLGIYLSSHPLEDYRAKLRKNGFIPFSKMTGLKQKKRLKACGVVEHIKQIRTKRGDPMAFMTVSDEQEETETVIFPELYRKVKPWLSEEMIICFEGNVEERNDKMQWLLSNIWPFSEENLSGTEERKLFIKISAQEENDALNVIRQIADYFPGNTPVIVHHAEKRRTYQLASEYYVNLSHDCLTALYDYFGKDSVVTAGSP
ncbi:DNA polymerase III subunit alpha [Thalassobacillus pellis]|uniref:DNA polymerase III subunit alpha n=1 Tax=Thalassobacillus pellis TaxID=748008 RepID=UPI0019621DB0|nr:DNA polymerase III subunit alpha [Thalassobacillus pellis]MBM7554978.1 DNA polymerase-3 subunit alpha [Thalassobacillus pellis]